MHRLRLLVVTLVLAGAAAVLVLWLTNAGDPESGDEVVLTASAPAADERRFAVDDGDLSAAPAPAALQAPDIDTAATATPDLGHLVLTLLHSDGVPAAGCRVVLARDDEVLAAEWADATGRAVLAAFDGPASVWVGGATTKPQRFELRLAHGAHTLTLPTGAVVEGHVRLEPPAPAQDIVLALDEDTDRKRATLPQAVDRALRDTRAGRPGWSPIGQRLGDDGSFRFTGLARSTEHEFRPPVGWGIATVDEALVTSPASGVRLVLLREPVVRLRVVHGDGRPAALAQVTGDVSGAHSMTTVGVQADAEGRAAFPLPVRCQPPYVKLALASADLSGRRTLDLGVLDWTRDHDLGDIALDASWTIPFRARRPDGTPIEGATLRADCGAPAVSPSTGANGLGELRGVPARCPDVIGVATGHAPALVPLPPDEPQAPLDVVLEPCAGLRIVLLPPERVSDGLGVRVSWDAPPEDESERRLSSLRDFGGSGATTVISSGPAVDASGATVHRRTVVYIPRTDAAVSVATGCLPGEQPITVRAVDWSGYVVAESPPLRLAAGEQREYALLIERAARPLEVVVTDLSGAPQEGVECDVSLPASARRPGDAILGFSQGTDARGRVITRALFAPLVQLEVSEPGFAPVRRLVTPGVDEHVVLDAGQTVVLRCVDPAGLPVPVFAHVRRADGDSLDLEPAPADPAADPARPQDAWRFEHLPPETVAFEVRDGGRAFRLEHDARQPEALLELPAAGQLEVMWRSLPGDDVAGCLLVAVDADGNRLQRELSMEDRDAEGCHAWPRVYPGSYSVRLFRRFADDTEQPLLGPATVEVRADEVTSVELR